MTPRRRRKCRHCGQLYDPDPRNLRHQRYCSKPDCRQASKAASQARWRVSPKGRDYFRGAANVHHVQAWRKAHPGYWRKRRKRQKPLQDHCSPQVLVPPMDTPALAPRALQDVILTQGLLLTGLVVQLTDSALQEDIASTTQRLVRLGQQIQGPSRQAAERLPCPGSGRSSHGRGQASAVPPEVATSAETVQLDRPPSGPG